MRAGPAADGWKAAGQVPDGRVDPYRPGRLPVREPVTVGPAPLQKRRGPQSPPGSRIDRGPANSPTRSRGVLREWVPAMVDADTAAPSPLSNAHHQRRSTDAMVVPVSQM